MNSVYNIYNNLKRYFFGDMDGLIGKVNQHLNTYDTNINNLPSSEEILSVDLKQKLINTPFIFNKGSMAYIYRTFWKDQDIVIKVISEKIKYNIEQEVSTINLIGNIKSNISGISKELTKIIYNEIDMKKEKENCYLLKNNTNNQEFGISFLNPIEELCTDKEFVYLYEKGISLKEVKEKYPNEKLKEICRRIVLFHYDTIHNNSIVIGDLNINNILYQPNSDNILIIDYGCVEFLSIDQQNLATKMHKSQKSIDALRDIINEWKGNKQLFELLFYQSRPFFDLSGKIYKFSEINTKINLLDIKVYNVSFPPKGLLIIRSSSQVIQLLKQLEIEDNYSKDISKIIK